VITAAVLILSPIILDCIYILFQAKPGDGLERLAMRTDIKNGVPTDSTYANYLYKPGSGFHEWRNWQASAGHTVILISSTVIVFPKCLECFCLDFMQEENDVSAILRIMFRYLKNYGYGVLLLAFQLP
jgi:hypothetical protein